MRVSAARFKGLWVNPDEVPFQELLPLKLKTSVSGKRERSPDSTCIHELSILFACLKKNDFSQSLCDKEFDVFRKCYSNVMNNKALLKEQDKRGDTAPGSKNLTHKQVSVLLKKFP